MDITAFLIVFTVLLVIYMYLGFSVSADIQSADEYVLGGRKLGVLPLTGTLIATQLGGGMILGTAEAAYSVGFGGMLYSLGMCAGFLVLGLGVAGVMRNLEISTIAELFERQYNSPFLKKVASLLSIIVLGGLCMGQVVASKALLHGLGVTNPFFFFMFWAGVIWYTMYGGLMAVVYTDVLQVLLIVGVFGFYFMHTLLYGNNVSETFHVATKVGSLFSVQEWTSFFAMPFLFSFIEQDLAQRFFAAKSARVAQISALLASAFLLLFAFVPVFIGVHARLNGIVLQPGENPLISYLQTIAGPWGYALILSALVAAIASTADSLLCAITSNVVQDFVPRRYSSSTRMLFAQIITALTGGIAVFSAFWMTDILSVLTQSYELLIVSTVVSLLMALASYNGKWYEAAISISFGILAFIVLRIVPVPVMPREVIALLCSMGGYMVGFIIRMVLA